MLLHTFDRDPNESPGFVWTEVYASSRVFKYHLQNPDLNAYLEAAGEITDAFSAALQCNVWHRVAPSASGHECCWGAF